MQTKSGKPIFPVGIGTWGIASHVNPDNLGSQYRGVEPVRGHEHTEIDAIRYSISKGQNHLDCAELYGGFYTDEVVGRALAGLPRQDLFIADKLWKTSVAAGRVLGTVQRMLQKLGTTYIDLLYIHAPWDDAPWRDAIPQIDDLIDSGVVRYFGVSNFTIADMVEASKMARHPIAANQMNYNVLYKKEVDDVFHNYCQQHNIQIVAYQPIKRQAVLTDPAIQDIARAHGATPGQVALAWLLAHASLPIPKATQKQHIDENIGAVKLRLSEEELDQLDRL